MSDGSEGRGPGAHWTDGIRALWTRWTYCTRYGHNLDQDGDCLNCGAHIETDG